MSKRLLVMAGGTGGHIFPGIAVADFVSREGWDVHWLGTAERMEATLVPKAGYEISYIDVAGIRGNGIIRLLTAPFRIAKSIIQAMSVMRRFKPDLVLGMGGFASGPGGVAAKLLNIPLIIHEQNATAGMTNRLLAKISNQVLLGFDGAFGANVSAEKYRYVGNPVRPEFCRATDKPRLSSNGVNILVVGGSLGARVFNQYLPETFSQFSNLVIQHQCGQHDYDAVAKAYQQQAVNNVTVVPFIDDMVAAFEWADLVVCRAGALTVAEIAAVGVAAVFIPLPYAVDDHQTKNAEVLTQNGGALLVTQKQLEAGQLAGIITPLLTAPEGLPSMAQKSKQMARPDALESVINACRSIVEELP